jgi:hypothetical protein
MICSENDDMAGFLVTITPGVLQPFSLKEISSRDLKPWVK